MKGYSFTNKAISDLSNIWEYTQNEWGSEQAEGYYRDLLSKCEYLSIHPEIGRLYSLVHDELTEPFGL
jgi:toxin ParE1/3/4